MMDRDEYGPNIDRQHPIELLQRKGLDVAWGSHSGVVHQDVQAAELRHRLLNRADTCLASALSAWIGTAVPPCPDISDRS